MSWTGHRDPKLVALYRHLRHDDGIARMSKIQFIVEPVARAKTGADV
jgi:hypothetical protein